jgi:hypothetical protein
MPRIFNVNSILPGDGIHILSLRSKFADKQRALTGSAGSHDTCVVNNAWLGESTMKPPFAHLTALADYEAKAERGEILISVLRIPDLTLPERWGISQAWCERVRGTLYDFAGIAKLGLKLGVRNWTPEDSRFHKRALGWEFANWCTEGWAKAIREAGKLFKNVAARDPFADKKNPTPRTVENRVRDGRLIDVSGSCLTAYGQQFRLVIPEIL